MRYLLDTDVVSDLVRNPGGRVTERIRAVGEAEVSTSVVVAAELWYGAIRRRSERLIAQLDTVLAALPVHPFEPPGERIYGALRARLEQEGRPIGGNDLLIGSHALLLDLTLATGNTREFERIEGLRCENWLR